MQYLYILAFLLVKFDSNFLIQYAYFGFSFYKDCFLGIASCIIRLIKATFLNVVFMARLDWSFLGRPLEKFGKIPGYYFNMSSDFIQNEY